MRMLALCALVACQSQKSAERQESFGQQVDTRRDEGAVRVTETVEEYNGRQDGVSDGRSDSSGPDLAVSRAGGVSPRPQAPGLTKRTVTVTERAPVVVTTTSQTNVSWWEKLASKWRWGWNPVWWAAGLLALAAGAYGLYRLKARLGI